MESEASQKKSFVFDRNSKKSFAILRYYWRFNIIGLRPNPSTGEVDGDLSDMANLLGPSSTCYLFLLRYNVIYIYYDI